MKTNHAFLFDLDTLEEFYLRCIDANANSLEDKNKILIDLMQEKRIAYMGSTDKSCPELATEFIKNGVKARSYTKGKNDREIS